ncbi:hypothetical protein B0H15DRAFT_955112 [Mycena belliarum]|uniref:Uncharacterized protein n=1 Tax=Mycena belliarum TaxID=1033014 RepID=A0AAD6TT99_9AGAR|nr:hypothetical protein B0H15DRAFT_955112 [Mycena belliae]
MAAKSAPGKSSSSSPACSIPWARPPPRVPFSLLALPGPVPAPRHSCLSRSAALSVPAPPSRSRSQAVCDTLRVSESPPLRVSEPTSSIERAPVCVERIAAAAALIARMRLTRLQRHTLRARHKPCRALSCNSSATHSPPPLACPLLFHPAARPSPAALLSAATSCPRSPPPPASLDHRARPRRVPTRLLVASLRASASESHARESRERFTALRVRVRSDHRRAHSHARGSAAEANSPLHGALPARCRDRFGQQLRRSARARPRSGSALHCAWRANGLRGGRIECARCEALPAALPRDRRAGLRARAEQSRRAQLAAACPSPRPLSRSLTPLALANAVAAALSFPRARDTSRLVSRPLPSRPLPSHARLSARTQRRRVRLAGTLPSDALAGSLPSVAPVALARLSPRRTSCTPPWPQPQRVRGINPLAFASRAAAALSVPDPRGTSVLAICGRGADERYCAPQLAAALRLPAASPRRILGGAGQQAQLGAALSPLARCESQLRRGGISAAHGSIWGALSRAAIRAGSKSEAAASRASGLRTADPSAPLVLPPYILAISALQFERAARISADDGRYRCSAEFGATLKWVQEPGARGFATPNGKSIGARRTYIQLRTDPCARSALRTQS